VTLQSLDSVARERPMRTIWGIQMITIRICCEHCADTIMIEEHQLRPMPRAELLDLISVIQDDDQHEVIQVLCSMVS
jgi:hypothetical protein